ncbi:MAG: YsnF/AvaK domain-containing protein [Chloroflexota bacterium]|nr:YsnF/AvaK domain-containing protein [Chloroflexota bacterium]
MQENGAPLVQFGPGGEQWWQIPAGASLVASDGVTVGTVLSVGTAYLRAGDSMLAGGDLYVPLQAIGGYDAASNVAHLTVTSEAVRAMFGNAPANDAYSLQAMHPNTLPLPMTAPPTAVRELNIALREQEVVITVLPNVVKEVLVRRELRSNEVTVTETVRKETAHIEVERETP